MLPAPAARAAPPPLALPPIPAGVVGPQIFSVPSGAADAALAGVVGEIRFYAVWCIRASAVWSGVHAGPGTAAHEGVLALAAHEWSVVKWTRVHGDFAAAIVAYEREATRHGSRRPTVLFLW